MSNSQLYIDKKQLIANLSAIREFTGRPLLFVVKANAYGHGLAGVVQTIINENLEFLGVVNVDEAAAVRKSGFKGNVLILGAIFDCDIEAAIELNIDIPLWRPDQIRKANEMAVQKGRVLNAHLKIDTGMGRLGILPDNLAPTLEAFSESPGVKMRGVYSHFTEADAISIKPAEEQLQRFQKCLAEISERGFNPEYRHIANSPASMRLPAAFFDLVRVGITAYGLKPIDDMELLPGMKPIATWKTRLAEIKSLPKGHGISYGAEYSCKSDMVIGVIPVGYADGLRRYPSAANSVLVNGVEAPVLGRVCMDHAVLDLSNLPGAKIGDDVTIIGVDGAAALTAEELAQRWGTNNYDVLANIGPRVERVYI